MPSTPRFVTLGGVQRELGTDADVQRLGAGHLATLRWLIAEARRKGRTVDDEHLIAVWLHGRPALTTRVYRTDIERYRRTIAKSLTAARLEDVQGHMDSLGGLAPRTRSRALCAIRSFYDFHVRIGTISISPAAAMRPPKVPQDLAERILVEADIAKLLSAPVSAVERTILRLLYMAGLRASELATLYWRQVVARGSGEGQVTVTGKGGKIRSVLIPGEFYRELVDLKVNRAPSDPVFPSAKDPCRPIGTRQLLRLVKRAAAAAGLSTKVSSHWLRHSHASHALDNGAPIQLVRDTLGHASVATTNRYAHARPNDGSARYLSRKSND